MQDYFGEKERIEKSVINLIQNIFDTICGENKISASVATATIEFQRFLHIYKNIDIYKKSSEDEGFTGFERELIKRVLTSDKELLDKAFKVAPFHIKEQMVDCFNIQHLMNILDKKDLVLVDYALTNIAESGESYDGLYEELEDISIILKNEFEKETNKDNKEKIELMLETISYIQEDLQDSPKNLPKKTVSSTM